MHRQFRVDFLRPASDVGPGAAHPRDVYDWVTDFGQEAVGAKSEAGLRMEAPPGLNRNAQAAASAFACLAERLSDVRGAMTDLEERLRDLASVLSDQRRSDEVIESVAAAAERMRRTVRQASSAATDENIDRAARKAQSALTEIRGRLAGLNAVTTLSKVTARSLDVPGFDTYSDRLRALIGTLHDEAQGLDLTVQQLDRQRAVAGRILATAATVFDGVVGGLADSSRARQEIGGAMAASQDELAGLILRMPQIAGRETVALVAAMQFADRLAQRLEHVQVLMSLVPERGQNGAALAAAQIDALAAEIRVTSGDVESSLSRLAGVAGSAGAALSGDGQDGRSSGAASAIALNRKILSDLSEGTADALAAIVGAAEEGDQVRVLADTAAARLDRMVEAADEINLAAINASLLARCGDDRERALQVLSFDVRHQAQSCAQVTAGCRSAIGALADGEDIARMAAVIAEVGVFTGVLKETGTAVDAADSAVEEVERLRVETARSLSRLGDAQQAASDALRTLRSAGADLAEVARALPRTLASGHDDLADLMDIYTMESEREVHRRLFGMKAEAVPPDVPVADAAPEDVLASVLF